MYPRSTDSWGIGACVTPTYFTLPLYDEATGAKYGNLTKTSKYGLRINKANREYEQVHSADIEYLSHSNFPILKVDKCFNPDFLRVLWKSSTAELYVSKEDLNKLQFKYHTYRKYLEDYSVGKKGYEIRQNGLQSIGVNLTKNCLNLREHPSVDAAHIICMLSNDWEQNFVVRLKVLEIKGNWAMLEYVEVHPSKDYPNDGDCYSINKNEKKGWAKALADDGYPNIWFAVTSY